MERIVALFLKRLNKKENLYLLFLSYLLSFCMFTYVNEFIYKILPETEITISSFEKETGKNINHITILETEETKKNYNIKEIFLKNKKFEYNLEGFNYVKKGDFGYSSNAIHLNNSKNKITLFIKKIPNAKIRFYNVGISEKILIESSKYTEILDLSENKIGEIIDYFPFSESKLFLLYAVSIYFILGLLLFGLIKILIKIIKKIKIANFLNNYNPKTMVLIIYLIISMYVTIKFFTNTLPKDLFTKTGSLFGDQEYYWHKGTLMKNFNLTGLKEYIHSFRGYFVSVLPMIAQLIGEKLKINSLWLFYMINNFFTSILLGYVMPELNNKISLKKSKNYQIFILLLLFIIFWKGMFYSVLADMIAMTCAFWSILLVIDLKEKKKAFLSGICLAVASLSRSNFTLGIYVILITFFLSFFIKKIRIKKSFFLFFFLGVIIVCIPQIKINYETGHIGLFSYDKKGSFVKGETLKESHLNGVTRYSFTGWPYISQDKTAQRILKEFSDLGEHRITFKQGLTAYIQRPMDFFIITMKKIFLSIDLKTSEIYPPQPYKPDSGSYIFSFFNYFVLSTVIFFIQTKVFRKRFFSKKEKKMGILLYFLYMFPQIILHVEWRYYLFLYLIIYYIFSFKFAYIIEEEEMIATLKQKKYLKYLCIYITIFFVVSSYYF
ncbi:hypothetical protein EII29_02120 [Leptotrichia sp. OH3620_COT-345]|uniref:hypothetical protein n=1 Tax=Leptotrichia sp. OH3620_COT-345 TaxID=2491048 RepID=UPI000F645CB5|nr:hypothetical protein [Leptotrichia sp. OH3620_COT-345]RRD40752.1 hypothetical protein EII29_02120 [Leptotrichia sp. OH3620_COT-345]